MSNIDIILINEIYDVIEKINIAKPKTYSELLSTIKDKFKNLSENYNLFYITEDYNEEIITTKEDYSKVIDIVYIRNIEVQQLLSKLSDSLNINFEDKYTCLICENIIENEKPYFCFQCQKLYHKDCLIAWKNSNEENDNDFKCPACNYELELENLKEKIDYEDNKNREEKSIKKIEEYMEYKSKVIPLLKYIYGEINEIKSLLEIENTKSQKNSENNIPNIIKDDLNYIKIFLNTIFSNNEYIEKIIIYLILMMTK